MKPYIIPGFEDVGITGTRKSVNTKKLEEILKPYLDGGELAIKPEGQVTQTNNHPDAVAIARVGLLPTSM